jgi:cephalosporin hydroxylase
MQDSKQQFYDVYNSHTGFASDKWTHYPFIYDMLFSQILERGNPITLLEIGVQNGGSLEIWKKYLPAGSEIHGLDINEKCKTLQFSKNIHFHLGNAADKKIIESEFKDIQFDVIIDDGSHISKEVIATFINLFGFLKEGGLYLIEDLEHSYYIKSGGGFREKNTAIEYLKKLVDALNYDYIPKQSATDDLSVSNLEIDALKNYSSLISSITFYTGMCAIHKYYKTKTVKPECMKTGNIEDVQKLNRKTIAELESVIKPEKEMYGGKELINYQR